MKKIKFSDFVQRSIGIFTLNEIKKIKKLDVAVIGVGAIGGHVAISLARLGVGTIRIIDPDKFEVSNLNRQQGATTESINVFKVSQIKKDINKINPFTKVVSKIGKVNKKNAKKFILQSDCVVDSIDYFKLEDELELHRACSNANKWVFTGQIAGSVVSMIVFPPNTSKPLEKLISFEPKKAHLNVKKFFPILPKGVTFKKVQSYLKKQYIPSYTPTSPILANLILEQIVRILIRNRRPICVSPRVCALDINDLRVVIK